MIDFKGIDPNTVAITDFKIMANKIAKVVISFTGKFDRQAITASLSEQLDNLATPIENSFTHVRAGVALGFIRANQEVRVVEPKELKASYKVMSNNMMMDDKDKSLWEVRKGASGTYLARHGNEDLSELVSAATNPRGNVPRLNNIALASVAKREFVAFASASGDMDYGFCVGVNAGKKVLKVVAASDRQATVIDFDQVVTVVATGEQGIQIPNDVHKRILATGISRADADQEITYYQKLFGYAPAYLREVIEQVEGTMAM